jgi:hypothetical protein
MWRSQLPDPVASHWGTAGRPDGFSSLNGLLSLVLGIGVVLVLVFGGTTWGLGHSAVIRRVGAAATAWVALFLSAVLVGSLYVQRGLSDARDASGVSGVLLAALLASLLPAIIIAALVPGDLPRPTSDAVAADAPRVPLAAGEPAAWTGRASASAAFAVAIPVAALLVAIVLLTRVWALVAIDVVVLGALATLSAFVVRVDQDGLTVRSAFGWPRYRVPLDEVVRADVTQVDPLRQFGGWGWRVGRDGRVGVVLHKGDGLLVERTGGRSIVVTVDGAATAAGLLNTLADRSRR